MLLCCDVAAADGLIFEPELRLSRRNKIRTEYRPAARSRNRKRLKGSTHDNQQINIDFK